MPLTRLRRPTSERAPGQSLVEFALVLPLLILFLLGSADFARALSAYISLGNVVREGAHYGSFNPTDTNGIRAAALNEVGGTIFNVAPTVQVITGQESFRDKSTNQPFEYVRVIASYEFRPIFAVPPFRRFTMTRSAQMRVLPG